MQQMYTALQHDGPDHLGLWLIGAAGRGLRGRQSPGGEAAAADPPGAAAAARPGAPTDIIKKEENKQKRACQPAHRRPAPHPLSSGRVE